MRRNWRIAVLVLSLAVGGSGLTTGAVLAADPSNGGGGMMRGHDKCGGWMEALNLTPDQLTRGHRIKVDAEKQIIQAKADLKMQRLELKDALLQDNVDLNQVNKIATQMGTLVTHIVNLKAKMVSDLMGLLNPDQRQKAKTMMMEKGGMEMHEGMGSESCEKDDAM